MYGLAGGSSRRAPEPWVRSRSWRPGHVLINLASNTWGLEASQSVRVHTLRTTQTSSTITITVPSSPNPSISFLLLIHRSTSNSEHAKDRRYLEGIVQCRAVIAVTHRKACEAWKISHGSPSALEL